MTLTLEASRILQEVLVSAKVVYKTSASQYFCNEDGKYIPSAPDLPTAALEKRAYGRSHRHAAVRHVTPEPFWYTEI